MRAAEADGAVSADFGAALGLAPDHPDRDVRVRESALGAAHSAGRIGRVGVELIREMRLLREIGNPHLSADLAVGAAALASGIAGASVTLRANLRTARAHHASPTALSEIGAEASRLSHAQQEVEQFSAALSSEFDD
ncbi:cyclodeaminase/cyclohydrolase family protein [Microbacterium sp. Se5.02b]|uniref:cyclodeaminase/cyclohydrolase family protein n=1 Tax=Microbacterium sp. Se5.02b TaxID=2864103 RepID=UPI0037C5AC11